MDNVFVYDGDAWAPRLSRKLRLANGVLKRLGRSARLCPGAAPVMANVQHRVNLFHLVSQTIAYDVPGDIVEVGCHDGLSSVVMKRVIDHLGSTKALYLFDSFAGLPPVTGGDREVYEAGDMAASLATLRANFARMGLAVPETIFPGWFEDTLPGNLPESISFAHVDGDLYASTLTALTHVYPRLSKGAICMFGVYWDPAVYDLETTPLRYKSPGVRRACDEFFADKPEAVSVLWANEYTNGYFRKLGP